MAAKVYTDKDANLKDLKGKTLAVLEFVSQGHAHALNLKESGCKVIIGLYKGSKSRRVAKQKGFEVYDTAEAVRHTRRNHGGLADTKQAKCYKEDIEPNLTKGKASCSRTGLPFATARLCRDVDVIMVAPKGLATLCAASSLKAKVCRR